MLDFLLLCTIAWCSACYRAVRAHTHARSCAPHVKLDKVFDIAIVLCAKVVHRSVEGNAHVVRLKFCGACGHRSESLT